MKGYYVIINKELVKNMLKKQGINNQRKLAEIIGIGEDYVSQIMNGRPTTRVTAYAFTKAISTDAEINDFFEII